MIINVSMQCLSEKAQKAFTTINDLCRSDWWAPLKTTTTVGEKTQHKRREGNTAQLLPGKSICNTREEKKSDRNAIFTYRWSLHKKNGKKALFKKEEKEKDVKRWTFVHFRVYILPFCLSLLWNTKQQFWRTNLYWIWRKKERKKERKESRYQRQGREEKKRGKKASLPQAKWWAQHRLGRCHVHNNPWGDKK